MSETLHPAAKLVLNLASGWHKGQTRKNSAVPYVTHPIEVAELLARDGFGWLLQCVALLHDVLEDCKVSMADMVLALFEHFPLNESTQITSMVWAMSSPDKMMGLTKKFNRTQRKTMMRGHFAAVSWMVAVVKIYDRYTNIMDMSGFKEDFKPIYAQETLELMDVLEDRASLTPGDQRLKVYQMIDLIRARAKEFIK